MTAWFGHIDWGNVGAFLGVVTLTCGVAYRLARRLRRRMTKAATGMKVYFDDHMTEIAAAIADPIVNQLAQMRISVDHLHRTMREADAECRMDREALWHRVGGRP